MVAIVLYDSDLWLQKDTTTPDKTKVHTPRAAGEGEASSSRRKEQRAQLYLNKVSFPMMLFFLSKKYFQSRNCLREIRASLEQEKP